MNHALRKFLTPDEDELVKLASYHLTRFEKLRLRQGSLQPDDIQIMAMISQVIDIVTKTAENRKSIQDKKLPAKNVICPTCEDIKNISHSNGEPPDWSYVYTRYYCHTCQKNFANLTDSNHQPLWFLNFVDQLEKKHPLKAQGKLFKKACTEEAAAYIQMQQADKAYFKCIEEWRDYLWAIKLQNQWPGLSPIGES